MKAIALISGGLDSALAAKTVADQGIEIIGVKFTSPFCTCDQRGKCYAKIVSQQLDIPLKLVSKGKDYLQIVKNPRFGYGSGMNPCIDCRIYMFRKAWEIAKDVGAEFIVTGEVLNQRPMSQHIEAVKTIEKEAGLQGKILRPLSAKHLPETEPEKKGWVKREKLLAIKGRSRKSQIEFARVYGIDSFACASGGCLLTQKAYARKLKDLFDHKKEFSWKDIVLLKHGRHFRYKNSKIIVGRNEAENGTIYSLKNSDDFVFEVPDHGSPITLLQGEKTDLAIEIAAGLTALYSDAKEKEVKVKFGKITPEHVIKVKPLSRKVARRLNIVLEEKNKKPTTINDNLREKNFFFCFNNRRTNG